jgi:hypothetical protein
MSFPALSEITRGSQVPLRNAVPADAPGRSHARWDGRRVIRGNASLPTLTGLFLTHRSHLGGATSASADAMATIPAMPDELSVDVFTELRRVTSAGDQARGLRQGPVLAYRPREPADRQAAGRYEDQGRAKGSWRPGHAPRPVMRQRSGWNMSVRRSSGSTPPCTPRWVARSRDRSGHRFRTLVPRAVRGLTGDRVITRCITRPVPVPGATIRARSPAKPGGIRRFRYEANGQECSNWFKIPQGLDPASAKWQMFLLGPGARIRA